MSSTSTTKKVLVAAAVAGTASAVTTKTGVAQKFQTAVHVVELAQALGRPSPRAAAGTACKFFEFECNI